MANRFEPTEEQVEHYEQWASSLPTAIAQHVAKRFPPWKLYRMDSGHRAFIYSVADNGTVTVAVTGEYNKVMFGRRVFGIDPNTLVECELPGPDEELGEVLTSEEDIDKHINEMKKQHESNS